MFPTPFHKRLAQLCAFWLAVLIVCSVATIPSLAPVHGDRLSASPVLATHTPYCPGLPDSGVAIRAALTEAGEESRLAASSAVLTTERPQPRGTVAHSTMPFGGAARGDARPAVLVLRV